MQTPPDDAREAFGNHGKQRELPLLNCNTSDLQQLQAQLIESIQRECLRRRPDRFLISQQCLQLGFVPSQLRAMIWAEWLGVSRQESSSCAYLNQSIAQVETDLVNQKVIRADVARTRANESKFKQNLSQNLQMLTRILTFYCKSRNIRYKQGMNEVLAPFLMVQQDLKCPEQVQPRALHGESGLFQCFYAMIDRFLPQVFLDREFKSLQCSLQLYRLLLLYHDPGLCHYLDQHDMTPEIYVTPWFMTLFARNLVFEILVRLWDRLLMENDPLKLHFLAVALVVEQRELLFESDVAMLPQVLSRIAFQSVAQVDDVWQHAQELFENTPISFRKDLYNVCYVPPGSLAMTTAANGADGPASFALVDHFALMACLGVYPHELVTNLMSRICLPPEHTLDQPGGTGSQKPRVRARHDHENNNNNSILFMVIDCRTLKNYDACHLSLSYHIDPEIVSSPEALEVLFSGFSRMKGCHFCFVGESVDGSRRGASRSANGTNGKLRDALSGLALTSRAKASWSEDAEMNGNWHALDLASTTQERDQSMDLTRLMLLFLQRGFEQVCFLKGGFDALKKEILGMNQFAQDQLLVYDELVNGENQCSSSQRGAMRLLAARKATGDWLSRMRSNSEKAAANASLDALGAVVSPVNLSASNSDTLVQNPPRNTSMPSAVVDDMKENMKPAVTAFSKKLQTLGSAAKEAFSNSTRRTQSTLSSSSRDGSSGDIDLQLVDEEEWVQVCVKTQEALERSRRRAIFKEVSFETGPLGISFMHSRHGAFSAVVETLTAGGAAAAKGQIKAHDFLVAINDQSVADVPFAAVVRTLKTAPRPVLLRFQNGGDLEKFDALAFPPSPPILMIASHHSLCISWQRAHMDHAKYHLQYTRRSEFRLHPWASVVMKQSDSSRDKLDGIGITDCTNGTLVGLEPGDSLYFRVRCGDGEHWSPYSPASSIMTTLEKQDDTHGTVDSDSEPSAKPDDQTDASASCSSSETCFLVFLPGESPEYAEQGVFYYRVVLGLRARAEPDFDAPKLDLSLEKGTLLKCSERLVVPGTNQVFVRLCDVPLERAWAFENTQDGAMVLERLPDSEELYQTQRHMHEVGAPHQQALQAATAVQQQAKSIGSFLLNASGLKVSGPSVPMPPRVCAKSPTTLEVKWEEDTSKDEETRVTKYQLQYAKKRLTALWTSIKRELPPDTTCFTIEDLAPNTWYLVRIRSGNDQGWSAFSEASSACKTLELDDLDGDHTESTTAVSGTLATQTNQRNGNRLISHSDISQRPNEEEVKVASLFNKAMSAAALTLSLQRSSSMDGPSRTPIAIGTGCVNLDKWKQDAKLSEHKPLFTTAWKVDSRVQVSGDEELALLKDEANERLLVVSHQSFHCFHLVQRKSPQLGIMEYNKPLSSFVKITSKKSVANAVLMRFKHEVATQSVATLTPPAPAPAAVSLHASYDQLMFLIDGDVTAFVDGVRKLVNLSLTVAAKERHMSSFPA